MNYCYLEEDFEKTFIRGTVFSEDDFDGMGFLNYIHSGLSDQVVNKRQLVFTQTLKKYPHEYEKLQPVVGAALKLNLTGRKVQPGDRIEYVICRGDGPINERAYPIHLVELKDIDINFYMDRLYKRRDVVLKAKSDYDFYLKTIHWQKLRFEAIRSSGNKCELCSSPDELEVHHNTYENKWKEPLEDLAVLCHYHHELYHTWGVNDVTETSSDHSDSRPCRV